MTTTPPAAVARQLHSRSSAAARVSSNLSRPQTCADQAEAWLLKPQWGWPTRAAWSHGSGLASGSPVGPVACPHAASAPPRTWAAAVASQSGPGSTQWLDNATCTSHAAAAAPALRAPPKLNCPDGIRTTRSATRSTSSRVPSVDPESTTTSSAASVWARTEAMVSATVATELKVRTITDTGAVERVRHPRSSWTGARQDVDRDAGRKAPGLRRPAPTVTPAHHATGARR